MKSSSNNTNLIASIAVFADLCNTKSDIQSILSEFIKSVFAFEKTWSLDSIEMTQLLNKHFNFDLPEAVVKTCLNSLIKNQFVHKKAGKYSVIDTTYSAIDLSNKLLDKKSKQEHIEDELVSYYVNRLKTKINEDEKKELIDGFISYLLDNSVSDKYSTIFSSFIVNKSEKEDFITELNQIKEGIVLITGLGYTDDLNNIGLWQDELVIYLDTEHLFNSEGYNGVLYEKLFSDFFALIKELNAVSQRKISKKLIHLKYFSEVNDEVERFFYVAEKIILKQANSSPDNSALEQICKDCLEVSDIIKKKTQFQAHLRLKGINLKEDFYYHDNPQFNIEDVIYIEKYKNQFPEEQIVSVLKSFSRINFLRKGINKTSFEKCKHIILTGKNSTRTLSQDLEIKKDRKDIPFATDIYFITNRLWYKLNKGLAKGNILPSTLDVVSKAQIVLASQMSKSIGKKYEELQNEFQTGKTDKDKAQDLYYNLREKAKKPEEITVANLDEAVDFIFENDLERHSREKSELKQKAQEGEIAIRKLKLIEFRDLQKRKKPKKRLTRFVYNTLTTIFLIITISFVMSVIFLIRNLITDGDTRIGIMDFGLSLIVIFVGLYRFVKMMHVTLKRRLSRYYLDLIREIK